MGWLWFLGTLVPVIGLVQVGSQAMADRYSYVPYIGLFIMVAWGVPVVLSKLAYRKFVLGISMAIVLTILGICTTKQVSYWKDGETVFKHALAVTQNNYVAHDCLGNVYIRQNKIALAIKECSKAIEIEPTWAYGHGNLGVALAKDGKYKAALEHFMKAVELRPDLASTRYYLGKALAIQGRSDEALEQFREAIRFEPDWVDPMNDFAFVVAAGGSLKNQDLNEAIRFASPCVRNHTIQKYRLLEYACRRICICKQIWRGDKSLKPPWSVSPIQRVCIKAWAMLFYPTVNSGKASIR